MAIVTTGVRNLTSARKQQRQQGLCNNTEQLCPFPSRTPQNLGQEGGRCTHWQEEAERLAINRQKSLFAQNTVFFRK